jgi:hypothetical protein
MSARIVAATAAARGTDEAWLADGPSRARAGRGCASAEPARPWAGRRPEAARAAT